MTTATHYSLRRLGKTQFFDCGGKCYYRSYAEDDAGRCSRVHLSVAHYNREISVTATLYTVRIENTTAVFPVDSDLSALARHSSDWFPVVDWVLENAVTEEQLRLKAVLESLL